MKCLIVLSAVLLIAVVPANSQESTSQTVRVAAVQCYSRMGDTNYNRKLLSDLIAKAGEGGAKIVVLPECAVSGYMDPGNHVVWTTNTAPDEGEISILKTGEPVPGPSTEYFAALSRKLRLYLCLPLVEHCDGKFFNSQVLLDPDGKIIAHHRKRSLWPPGDGTWVTEGNLPAQVVKTPYGRLGLMICHDVHLLPEQLGERDADIVLYSVGWYAPNTENWYRSIFPPRYVLPYGYAIVVANWSAEPDNPGWPGHGYSCVIDKQGKVLAMTKLERGSTIVFADLPIEKK